MTSVISLQALTTGGFVYEVLHYWTLNKYTDNRAENRRLVLIRYKKGVRGKGWIGDKHFQMATSIKQNFFERARKEHISIKSLECSLTRNFGLSTFPQQEGPHLGFRFLKKKKDKLNNFLK